ncbi:reticulophagy regulator 1-like isoform X1 [Polyodon spathula]|nr:reticulophagy regulator 1-like isoform X1 [Polyodon spathula]
MENLEMKETERDTGDGEHDGVVPDPVCIKTKSNAEMEDEKAEGTKESVSASWLHCDCSLLSHIADALTWQRPLYSIVLFICTNSLFWFVALTSWRVYYLMALALLALLTVQMVKDIALSRKRGAQLWRSLSESWEVIDSRQESRPGDIHVVSESWMSCSLFFQEMSSFKQQNPGKFCLLACSLCTFFAVLGRCIPGVLVSYFVLLCAFVWPLLSSHELGQKLYSRIEPVLQKLDFGIGDFLQKLKERHEKQNVISTEDNSEAEISALCPKMNPLTMCKELSVSDTEASEMSWTDNGTFNLSEGHTPQTENSDDLDRPSDHEEIFSSGLSEFPSLDNGAGTNGDDEDSSIGLPTPRSRTRKPERQHASSSEGQFSLPPTGDRTLDLVNAMAGEVIAAAVSAAIMEQLRPSHSETPPQPTALAVSSSEETDTEDADDFELLDQSELEQIESELGLAQTEAETKKAKPSGFLSNLLGSH